MPRRLVLVGGGHAHMVTLARLRDFSGLGIRVTVVQPSRYHYYSGMGPGMLGGFYHPGEIRFDTRSTVAAAGGVFLQDRVSSIDPGAKELTLAGGGRVGYDVLSLNVGSEVAGAMTDTGLPDVFPVKPIGGLVRARERFLDLCSHRAAYVAVVGGGPSAAEICGNLAGLAARSSVHSPTIELITKGRLLARWPAAVVVRVRKTLTRLGVKVLEDTPVQQIDGRRIVLPAGAGRKADLVFVASGVRPPRLIEEAGLAAGEGGGLRVNRFLQSTAYPDIFGGGDCIAFEKPLDKVGVYAVRQNPVLLANLKAAFTGEALQPFDPGGGYLLILNMGDGTGVFQKGRIVFSGRLAFRIKDFIDRRFMRRFQQPALSGAGTVDSNR